MKATMMKKRKGRMPKRGLPAHIIVGGKLNVTEFRAMREAMKVTGIPTQSLFVAFAVRAYTRANGVDLPDLDPAQTLLPIA